MEERAADWKTTILSFDDNPSEKLTIRHRCPLEAIKNLWKDSENAEDLVYAPKKIFSDETMSKRIYNEMWTGQWWHALQVRTPSTYSQTRQLFTSFSISLKLQEERPLHQLL